MVRASLRWACVHQGSGAGSGGSGIFQAASLSAGHTGIFNTRPSVGATDPKGLQQAHHTGCACNNQSNALSEKNDNTVVTSKAAALMVP